MGEVAEAYAGCRRRVVELTADLPADQVRRPVPSCPRWTVHDVVAHVAGVVDDVLAGRMDGVATDPWTAAQVEARRSRPLPDLLAEWEGQAATFEALLDPVGDPGRQAVTDLVTHEHDLRLALGRPGARHTDAVDIAVDFVARVFVASAAAGGLSVGARTADGLAFGDPAAELVVRGPAFELMRAMTGRRSTAQLLAMDWLGDPHRALPAFTFGPFRPADRPIDE